MGNSNRKEIRLRGLGYNFSNLSFYLNNESILIPFYSNVINKVLTGSINKTTNLNLFYPNSIVNDINYSQLKQQIKFNQMIGDVLDYNIQMNMENKYSSDEEILFNNIINNQNNQTFESIKLYQKKININNKKISNLIENNEPLFNTINTISSINGSCKDLKFESEIEFSQTSVNTSKPSIYSNLNKQDKMNQTGKKKDFFQISSSKEKQNNSLIKKESQNISFDNELDKYLLPFDNNNKNQITNSNKIYKKSISPNQKNKIVKNSLNQKKEQPKEIHSNEEDKLINKNCIKKENINNIISNQNLMLSPIRQSNNDITKSINLPQNIYENSPSTNYSNDHSMVPKLTKNNNTSDVNSYVEIMKIKKRHLDKRKHFLIKDNFNNNNTFNKNKNKKKTKSQNCSFDNINKSFEMYKSETNREKSLTPIKKENNCFFEEKRSSNLVKKFTQNEKVKDNKDSKNMINLNEKKTQLRQNSKNKIKEKPQLSYNEKNELKKKNINDKIKNFKSIQINKNNNSNTSNIPKQKNERLKNNNAIIEDNKNNKSYLINGSFHISQDSHCETENKIKKNIPINNIPYSNLSDNSNNTSKFNINPQSQISYSMLNCTSFGNIQINTSNNENLNDNNNNINSNINNNNSNTNNYMNKNYNLNNKEEKIKNNNNINNLIFNREFGNSNNTSNFNERISNSLNAFAAENKFQSNTLRELYANYKERNENNKNNNSNDLLVIKEDNNLEKTISTHQNNISFQSRTSKNNISNNKIMSNNSNLNEYQNNNDDEKEEFQITSKIRESEFNDIDF